MKPIQDMNEPELRALTSAVLQAVEDKLPQETGFAVLFWPHGWGVAQYGANCRREDMIKMLRETAHRLEGRGDVPR